MQFKKIVLLDVENFSLRRSISFVQKKWHEAVKSRYYRSGSPTYVWTHISVWSSMSSHLFILTYSHRNSAAYVIDGSPMNLGQIVKCSNKWSDLHSMLCKNISAMSKRVVSLNVANKFCVYFVFDLRVGTKGFRGYVLTK